MSASISPDEDRARSAIQLRLRPGATVLDSSAEELHISFPNYSVTFTSPSVTTGIRTILATLSTTELRTDLISEVSKTTGLSPKFIDYLIDVLLQSECLLMGSSLEGATEDPLGSFYSYLGKDSRTAVSTLAGVRILMVAPALSHDILTRTLSAAGLLADIVSVAPGSPSEAALDQIGSSLEREPSMVVSWDFPYRVPFSRQLNDLMIQRDIPILFGGCEGVIGRIGPHVIPRVTPCLECVNRRLLSQTGSLELRVFMEHRARLSDTIPPPYPAHPVFRDALLGMLVIELTQIVLKSPSRTIGAVIEHTFGYGAVERRIINKVPRCPSCSPARPQRFAWDAELAAPLLKNAGQ